MIQTIITYNGQDYVDGEGLPYFQVLPQADGRIVFRFGVLGDVPKDQDPKQPFNMGPYTVKVLKDGIDIFAASIPAHWWNAEWTFFPGGTGPKIVRAPAELVSARRMFPFGDTGCKLPTQPNPVSYSYMGSSNLTIYMPTTGERADIGLITDNSAYYMLGQSPSGMLAWGLSGGSCPMHFRDQGTGKPIDLIKYYSTNAYSLPGYQGSPWVAQGKQAANGYCEYGGGWAPQQAHYCEMSYVAYQATKNVGFLRDLQYSANFTVFADAYVSGGQKKPTVSGELRGIAWAFRNLFMAHAATKDAEADGTLPNDCMPSSYWKNLLDIQLVYYSKFMTAPDNQVFRLVPGVGRFAPWQCDYMLTALAFGVLTGHADWLPLYLWALGNAIARTNNTPWQKGGYPPGWGGAYYMDPKATWYDSFLALQGQPEGGSPTDEQIAALKVDPLNGGKALVGSEYLMTTRAVLVMADYLDKQGLANVRGIYPELDSCIHICETMNKSYGSMNPRVSVISTGGIDMPDSYSIETDKHGFIPVTPNGTLSSGPFYTTDNPAVLGNLSGSPDGVRFDAIAEGEAHIIATAQGAVPISKTVQVTVTAAVPLATATDLDFGELVVS